MSVEDNLRADLLAHAPLAALVSTRIKPDKMPLGSARPYIVYVVGREPEHLLDGTLSYTKYTFRFQCWGDTRASAEAVADALQAGLLASATVDPAGIPVLERQAIAEHDLDLEASEIVAEFIV